MAVNCSSSNNYRHFYLNIFLQNKLLGKSNAVNIISNQSVHMPLSAAGHTSILVSIAAPIISKTVDLNLTLKTQGLIMWLSFHTSFTEHALIRSVAVHIRKTGERKAQYLNFLVTPVKKWKNTETYYTVVNVYTKTFNPQNGRMRILWAWRNVRML